MSLQNDEVSIESVESLSGNAQRMYEMMQRKSHCDFNIIVNDEVIPLHKVVMIAASPYFENYEWHLESSTPEIPLGNFKSKAVQAVILFCYTGNTKFSLEYIGDVIKLANFLHIETLVHIAFNYYSKHINYSTCFEIARLADFLQRIEINNTAMNYVYENFLEVVETDAFLSIDYDFLLDLLKSDDIIINSEKEAFMALKKWIDHDSNERSKHLESLISHIKLEQLDVGFLLTDVQNFCSNNTMCISSILDSIKQKNLELTSPRRSTNRVLVVGGRHNDNARIVEIYNSFFNNWKIHTVINLGFEMSSFSCVIRKDQLIIIGGAKDDVVLDNVFSFDLKEKTVKILPPLLTKRCQCRSIILNDYLYVVGGFDRNQLKSVERYNFTENIWEYVASLSIKRCGFGICKMGNKIYIAGGHSSRSDFLDTFEFYSPTSDKWTTLKSMNKKRNYVELVACKGKIYAIGGGDTSLYSDDEIYDVIEVYDPESDNWTMIINFPSPRLAVGACAINNKIIIFGGLYKRKTITEVFIYNVDRNELKQSSHSGRIYPMVLTVPFSVLG